MGAVLSPPAALTTMLNSSLTEAVPSLAVTFTASGLPRPRPAGCPRRCAWWR